MPRNVTSRTPAEIALRDSAHPYCSLFENHPDAVFSLDSSGRLLSANRACANLCGYDPAEMIGRVFDPLVAPEQLDDVYGRLKRALSGTQAVQSLTIRHKDGHNVDVSITTIPMIVSGDVVGVYGIARDLTSQREIEAQLLQAKKMEAVGQLAAGVVHDFNNILAVIRVCSEVVKASLHPDDRRHEDVDMIRDAAKRAGALTRQLLALSRTQVLKSSIVDLNACVTELQPMLSKMIGDGIVLSTDLATNLRAIPADAGQIEQVIVNMAVNACDAMPNGGELRLATSNCVVDEAHARRHPGATTGEYIRLSISDNGCGMDDATLFRIFEPFFTTKGSRGTGLGLATADGIIRQYSGHISVTSAPGAGTTFDIYLPTINSAPSAPA